jgi:hypothetical protein
MYKLEKYFKDREETDKALDRYADFARDRNWHVGGPYGKLQLYELANTAFDESSHPDVASAAFHDLYETVRKWPAVQWGGRLAPSNEVFRVLNDSQNRVFRDPSSDLANFTINSLAASKLARALPSLEFVKQSTRYPWMPVSKVLHFINPALFPIWDWDVLWYKVMWREKRIDAPFNKEYKAFCQDNGLDAEEDGAIFLCNYSAWAAHYIQIGDGKFMEWFAEWMDSNFSKDIQKYNMEQRLDKLYATAFEFVAIGAAYLDR